MSSPHYSTRLKFRLRFKFKLLSVNSLHWPIFDKCNTQILQLIFINHKQLWTPHTYWKIKEFSPLLIIIASIFIQIYKKNTSFSIYKLYKIPYKPQVYTTNKQQRNFSLKKLTQCLSIQYTCESSSPRTLRHSSRHESRHPTKPSPRQPHLPPLPPNTKNKKKNNTPASYVSIHLSPKQNFSTPPSPILTRINHRLRSR